MEQTAKERRFQNGLLILYALLRIINSFYESVVLQCICAGILIIVTVLTFPSLKRSARIVLFVLAIVGSVLLITSHAGFSVWLKAILKNGDLLLLLICVPMISGPFYYEDYQSELKHLAQLRMRNMMSFLLLVTVSSHFLSVILSVGSIIITYELLFQFSTLYKADGPFLKTLHRSYASSGFWSPAWATVIIYSAYPDVLWVRIIPLALALAALFNAINLGGIYLETKKHPERYPDIEPDPTVKLDKRRLFTMIALAALMILAIVVVNVTTKWSLMLSVTVVSLVFPIITALVQQRLPQFRVQMKKYYNVQLPKVRSQIAVFMLAGFLGQALSSSGAGDMLVRLIPSWMASYPALMVGCIQLLMVLPTLAGVHPAATGTALIAAITPSAIGLTNYTFALAIILGWLLAVMMGPFSAASLLLSSYTGKSNYAFAVGDNWKFCAVCIVVFSVIISFVGPMMG